MNDVNDVNVVERLRAQIHEEGDAFDWESSGYRCFARRTPMKNWCGYVSVPAEHPWAGLPFNARVTPQPELSISSNAVPNVIGTFIEALRASDDDDQDDNKCSLDLAVAVHGGVTFARPLCQTLLQPSAADHADWVFGFDCAHAGDLVPGLLQLVSSPLMFQGDVYRDRDYVFGETSRLAAQLRMVQDRGFK